MMYKLLLVALAVLCASSEGGYVAPIDCMNECPSTSSVSCERGCRFYGLSLRFGDRNATMADCQQGCSEAYGPASEGDLTKSCLQGCNIYDDLVEKAAPHALMEGQEEGEGAFLGLRPLMTLREVAIKTVNGVRMLQTRVVAYFLAGDQLVQVETQPQVFIDMPANGGLIHESRQDYDAKDDSKPHVDQGLWGVADSHEDKVADSQSEVRVEKVRVLRKDFQHLLAVLSTTLIILLVAFYVLVLYRRSMLRKHKQANLAVAVQHEPLKLVLPEDLTKLSLVEEDEISSKQGISLPQAKV